MIKKHDDAPKDSMISRYSPIKAATNRTQQINPNKLVASNEVKKNEASNGTQKGKRESLWIGLNYQIGE